MTVNEQLIKDDLYHAVNGEWLEKAVIPDDKPSTGGFMNLRDGVEELLMEDINAMVDGKIDLTNAEQAEMIKYYQQAMNFKERDSLGAQPVQPLFEKLNGLQSIKELQAIAPEWALYDLPLPFSLGIAPDMKDTTTYILGLSVPGKILPDTTYYQEGNEAGERLLTVYKDMSQKVLELMDFDAAEATKLVNQAIEFDALFIPHMKSSEELADYTITYNPRTPEEIQAYSNEFNFLALFKELLGEEIDKAIVTQPKFFEAFQKVVNDENIELLRAWMIVNLANSQTTMLSEEIRQAGSLYQLALSGSPKTQSPEKHAYYFAINTFSQVVGDYYGKKYFGEKARQDVREMVEAMIDVYQNRLKANTWLTPETIELAIEKLDALDIFVGYPDTYPEIFTQLKVNDDVSFYSNTAEFTRQFNERDFARWNKDVDRSEWGMSAATVNAYFHPNHNLICFPAAILQAPFYSVNQSRSENYGGIGAVIAHEVSHAFDNNGAKFDAQGNMNNWWTEADLEAFNQRAQAMIKQWDGIEFAGGKVNGKLTVSENIADGGGLTAALEATKQEDDANLAEFFMNWARIWSLKARPEYQQLLLSIDVHSPAELRANIQVRNMDEFYETFDVKEGDKMYFAPEDRVVIW
ncbi:M13 family metallopeptidase [Ruoffia tabacinasalis]|uniref:M13 family peptidase n=1 Tax=Ruoffia tabacinasalis TaxID=87458 RepID=A0ABS0LG56_9LACT|nr:M13-type metalloendopeptidase [Ruoffia tabacinasalis]MBG9977210.1 M13 family peptidase [Ruoffia tabacinasalis]